MSPQLSNKEAAQYRERSDRMTRIRVFDALGGYLVLDAPLHSITTRLTIDLETRKYTSTNQIPNRKEDAT